MRKDRLIGALALTGALAGGGVAGAVLGIPGISGAQSTTTEATTTTEPPSTTTPPSTTPDAPDPGTERDGGDCHFGRGVGFSLEAAATALGLSESDLREQLRDGKTLAEVAKDKGVDVQKVIDALVADATKRIDQAVTDGDLTAERAATLKEGLQERITSLVNEGGPFKGGHPAFGRGAGFSLEAAATALGLSESDLREQLRDGKTLAEVAKDKGVDVQKVIDALVGDATKRIDQAVTDGDLTAERAATVKEGLQERITSLVNEGGPFKGGHPGGPGRGFPPGGSRFAPPFPGSGPID